MLSSALEKESSTQCDRFLFSSDLDFFPDFCFILKAFPLISPELIPDIFPLQEMLAILLYFAFLLNVDCLLMGELATF